MNKNIWNLYKNSERGQKAIALFSIKDGDNLKEKIMSIYEICNEYNTDFSFENLSKVDCSCGIFLLARNSILYYNLLIKENEPVAEYFNRLIDNIEFGFIDKNEDGILFKVEEKPIVKQGDYKRLCSYICDISLALYSFFPAKFFPILFSERFDILLKIFDALEISVPPLPSKTNKKGRLLFYSELNNEIIKFAEKNQFTPEETCACIYDYALMLIDDNENNDISLPDPTNIWMVYGGYGNEYEDFLKNPIKGAKKVWTGNENTKRGDVIVIYLFSPHSCIQSIWRAYIDGIYTPFNFVNSRIIITNGIVVPRITFNELKGNSYFSESPMIKKNLGGSEFQLSVKDYQELQRILTEKGFDVSVLPQLYAPNLDLENLKKELVDEKDVEEKLLMPLLENLGYSGTDWTRQLSQKAGRKEKAIPDFVFLPKGEIHFQNAPMIIEAKFDMNSNIERTKAYNQALSYARMMKSSIFGICDKDRLLIYKEKNGYFDRFKPVFEKHWQSLNDTETFRQLKLLIGKEIIARL